MKIKKFFLLSLFAIAMLFGRAQEIQVSEVPTAAVDKFNADHGNLPTYIKPTWYKVVQTGGTKTFYKVSYMNGTQFETYGYNMNGAELYKRFDWYNANAYNAIPALVELVKAVKIAFPGRTVQKVAEMRSARYNLNGYPVVLDDMRTRNFDLSNKVTQVKYAEAIEAAIFADATNFLAATASPGSTPNNLPKSTESK